MSYLIVRNATGQEHRIQLSGAVVLGRSIKCDLCLQDPTLSREHCRIEPNGKDWMIVDLDSRNGTYVGSHGISRHVLVDGDVVHIGDYRISYKTGAIKPGRASDPQKDQHARLMAANKMEETAVPSPKMPQPRPNLVPQRKAVQPEPSDDEVVSPYGLPFTRPTPKPIVRAQS